MLNIREISHILISHADSDHIGGIINLLLSKLEIKIHNIYLNPDSTKDTVTWRELRIALKDANQRNSVKIYTSLTTQQTGQLDTDQVKIEILAPSPVRAGYGWGGRKRSAKQTLEL
jgi:beta-lactamase superfamily II metal-dependent hydrolase